MGGDAAAQPKKRPAQEADEGAEAERTITEQPVQKKKMVIKKAIADEIRRLNEELGLTVPIRLGAVAANLARLDQANALEVLSTVEEQLAEAGDPNEIINQQAKLRM